MFEANPKHEFDHTVFRMAEGGYGKLLPDAGADAELVPELGLDLTLVL